MPAGDRTGPMGAGPMTGRGAGYCANNTATDQQQPSSGPMRPGRGRAMMMGLGRGRGCGRGAFGIGAQFRGGRSFAEQ